MGSQSPAARAGVYLQEAHRSTLTAGTTWGAPHKTICLVGVPREFHADLAPVGLHAPAVPTHGGINAPHSGKSAQPLTL
jgi:hypothetical protein